MSQQANSASPISQTPPPDLRKVRGAKANQELLTFANKNFDNAKRYRQQFEAQWYMNLAFYFGKHYLQWSSKSGPTSKLFEPPAPPWRVRMVVNKTRKFMRKEIAKLTKEKPMGFVVPKSSDDEDLLAAQSGDHLAEWFWREKMMMKTLRRTLFWVSLTGTGFVKDWWDPNFVMPDDTKGDSFIERVSPFHLFVLDVQEEELENQPCLIHAAAKNPDWVNKTYGVKINPDANAASSVLDTKFMNALGIRDSNVSNMTYVKEMWVKPCGKFKDGGVIIWAGEQVLGIIDGWPYLHNEYPFTKIEYMPSGRFYSESSVTDIIPIQKEYNRTVSQLVEAKNRMAKPQLLAPKGSIDPNKVTSEPGLIITYQPGFTPPTPLPMASIPTYVLEELNRNNSDMEDISSQHQFPAGVHAATAISYIQEQDDSTLSTCVASIEEGVERITRHFLTHVTQYWDKPRQIQIVGENGAFEISELDKTSLNGNTHYAVEAGTATPKSAAAKQAFIMELGKMGWIPPEKALRYLEMSESSRMYEEMQVDARQAQRENVKMQQGMEMSVNSWDNDAAHLMEHDNFRKRQVYENLDDQTKALFEDHVQSHKAKILVHKGVPLPVIQQAMQNPLEMDSLLYQPMPAMMGQASPQPPGPPMGGPPGPPSP